jgi:hypothetical protein
MKGRVGLVRSVVTMRTERNHECGSEHRQRHSRVVVADVTGRAAAVQSVGVASNREPSGGTARSELHSHGSPVPVVARRSAGPLAHRHCGCGWQRSAVHHDGEWQRSAAHRHCVSERNPSARRSHSGSGGVSVAVHSNGIGPLPAGSPIRPVPRVALPARVASHPVASACRCTPMRIQGRTREPTTNDVDDAAQSDGNGRATGTADGEGTVVAALVAAIVGSAVARTVAAQRSAA